MKEKTNGITLEWKRKLMASTSNERQNQWHQPWTKEKFKDNELKRSLIHIEFFKSVGQAPPWVLPWCSWSSSCRSLEEYIESETETAVFSIMWKGNIINLLKMVWSLSESMKGCPFFVLQGIPGFCWPVLQHWRASQVGFRLVLSHCHLPWWWHCWE